MLVHITSASRQYCTKHPSCSASSLTTSTDCYYCHQRLSNSNTLGDINSSATMGRFRQRSRSYRSDWCAKRFEPKYIRALCTSIAPQHYAWTESQVKRISPLEVVLKSSRSLHCSYPTVVARNPRRTIAYHKSTCLQPPLTQIIQGTTPPAQTLRNQSPPPTP